MGLQREVADVNTMMAEQQGLMEKVGSGGAVGIPGWRVAWGARAVQCEVKMMIKNNHNYYCRPKNNSHHTTQQTTTNNTRVPCAKKCTLSP